MKKKRWFSALLCLTPVSYTHLEQSILGGTNGLKGNSHHIAQAKGWIECHLGS